MPHFFMNVFTNLLQFVCHVSTFKQELELLKAIQATLWGDTFANLCFLDWQVYAVLKLSCYLEESTSELQEISSADDEFSDVWPL